MLLTADSKTGVRSTDGGRDGEIVGVELTIGGGCDGGAMLVVSVSLADVETGDVCEPVIDTEVEAGTMKKKNKIKCISIKMGDFWSRLRHDKVIDIVLS